MPENYIPGEVVRISLSVTDLAGALADPAGVVLRVKPPSGSAAAYTYGAGAEIIRDALGKYHADISLPSAGLWAYRWESLGANAGAVEGVITVSKSRVL